MEGKFQGIADEWLAWFLKGADGFCGRLANHYRVRPITIDERQMIGHIMARLKSILDEHPP